MRTSFFEARQIHYCLPLTRSKPSFPQLVPALAAIATKDNHLSLNLLSF
jgi:hypothetical protein